MRPSKQQPLHLTSGTKRRARAHSTVRRRVAAHATPLLLLCATLAVTAVYFAAIRQHDVELSFTQLSAFERQVQTLGNVSVYFVEPPAREELLSTFAPRDWTKLAARIELVAFVYDDMYNLVRADGWLSDVRAAFATLPLRGYGVVLFPCGCVVPNLVFASTRARFAGFECLMLPGHVMRKEHVAFVNVKMPGGRCREREKVLAHPWYDEQSWKLQGAREEHSALITRLNSSDT